MHKYLILNFRNAKLFEPKRNTKDISVDVTGYYSRNKIESFIEPITQYQISNIIHVLFGERPVTSMRVSYYKKNDYLFNKAANCFLKIDTIKTMNKYTKILDYPTEKVLLNKAIHSSKSSELILYWEKFKIMLGEDNFKLLIKKLEEVLKYDPLQERLTYIVNEMRKIDISLFIDLTTWLKSINRSDIANFFNSAFDLKGCTSGLNSAKGVQLKNNKGIDDVKILNGTIMIPVTEEDIQIISEQKGSATLLDGGFVYIVGIKYDSEIDPEGFTLVADISTKKELKVKEKVAETIEENYEDQN